MRVFTVIGRVIGGDVYEIPFQTRSFKDARRKWLRFVGVHEADVVWCAS